MPHALPASKLLFSHGRFDPSPVRRTQLPASSSYSDHDVKHFLPSPSPSPSFPDRFCSRSRRASTGGYGGDDYHLLQETQQKDQVEEHDSGNSILHNFSTLAEGILAIWEGEDSVRRRIEGLGERQKAMKEKLQGAEAVQRELRERLQVLEQHAHEEHASLQQLKQERLHTLAQGFNVCGSLSRHHHHHHPFQNGLPIHSIRSCAASSLRQQQWLMNSDAYCSLASAPTDVPPLFSSSRQFVAFEMLESVHRRLTSYMWAHMCERVRGMHGEEERGEYLRIFRGIEGQSVFGAKPLSEGTYAELLGFIEKGGLREEVNDAMAAAERRLVEEACREGYGCEDIGDIRKQMAVYLQCRRHFTSTELRSSLGRRSLRVGPHKENADRQLLDSSQLEIISDMRQASSRGTLGVLQPASKLIQLGCHFLCKSSKV